LRELQAVPGQLGLGVVGLDALRIGPRELHHFAGADHLPKTVGA
jgi:hypothetical protein